MQRDDTLNPAMLWVPDGEQLWNRRPARAGRSCAELPWRRDGEHARRGGALPGLRRALQRPVDLGQRINLCRQRHQQADAAARGEAATC